MSRRLKYFFFTGFSIIAAIFIIASGFTRMVYVNDYVKSVFIRVFNLYETNSSGSTVIA